MMTDTNTGRESSLDIRRHNKEVKYAPLIEDIKSTWNLDASLHIIVVSSLGAVPIETFKTLKVLFKTKKLASLIAKRCVVAALRGSWAIFYGKDTNNAHYHDTVQDPSEFSDSPSSSHLTDEEDGDILNE